MFHKYLREGRREKESLDRRSSQLWAPPISTVCTSTLHLSIFELDGFCLLVTRTPRHSLAHLVLFSPVINILGTLSVMQEKVASNSGFKFQLSHHLAIRKYILNFLKFLNSPKHSFFICRTDTKKASLLGVATGTSLKFYGFNPFFCLLAKAWTSKT